MQHTIKLGLERESNHQQHPHFFLEMKFLGFLILQQYVGYWERNISANIILEILSSAPYLFLKVAPNSSISYNLFFRPNGLSLLFIIYYINIKILPVLEIMF